MKKLFIILALCSMCICSCTTDAPPTEGSAESSTEATTTAATTEVTTEVATEAKEIEKFTPTEDNAVWGDDDDDGQLLSGDGMTSVAQLSSVEFGEIYISDQLRSAMAAVKDGKPIAVQYSRDMAEAAHGEWEIFSELPDGFEENYVTQITDKGGVMFITAEEIGLLTADPDVKLALGTVSYEFYSGLTENQAG